jgi:hypothetical protein
VSTFDEPQSPSAIFKAVRHTISRLRESWQRLGELATMDRCELERIANEVSMSGPELREQAARGPQAADQLRERMRLLGITRADMERVAHGLAWDLERTCARCNKKRICGIDLARRRHDTSWGGYCPNAVALTAVKNMMHHLPTP